MTSPGIFNSPNVGKTDTNSGREIEAVAKILLWLICIVLAFELASRGALFCVLRSQQIYDRHDPLITDREDDAPAATQTAIANIAVVMSCSEVGGLIQTNSC